MAEPLYRKQLQTPVGPMHLMATDKGICALEFVKPKRDEMLHSRLAQYFPDAEATGASSPLISTGEAAVVSYFSGSFGALGGLPLDLRGTHFELAIWAELLRIPCGSTLTYGTLAARCGGNPRAAGTAVGRNPASIIVPCHRVVGSDGSLTGYGGGLPNKEFLLRHEGALTATLGL